MKKVAVLLAKGFEEAEALVPVDIMRRAGLEVHMLALDKRVESSHQVQVMVDDLLENKKTEAYDAIVLPGGMLGAKNLAESSLVKSFLEEALTRSAMIAALCAAPAIVLESQGFLEGVKYTGYPDMSLPYGKGYQGDRPMVLDGNFLTAKSMAYSLDFGLALVSFLDSPVKAFKVAKDICYEDWDLRYKDFYHSFFESNQEFNLF